MTAYRELRQNLPPDLKKTLSGIRQYAESALNYLDRRREIFDTVDDRDQRRRDLDAERESVEELSIALFCHATYRKFVVGDTTIKQAVATFQELGIRELQIGRVLLSKRSDFYNLGAKLAHGLIACIRDESLRKRIVDNAPWHEIVAWHQSRRS